MADWSERIKALVKQYGSAEHLAVAAGVSYMTVMRWAAGKTQPSRLARRQLEQLENAKRRVSS